MSHVQTQFLEQQHFFSIIVHFSFDFQILIQIDVMQFYFSLLYVLLKPNELILMRILI